jgi:hypothetical protein
VFLLYNVKSKAYKLWDKGNNKIVINKDVIFHEDAQVHVEVIVPNHKQIHVIHLIEDLQLHIETTKALQGPTSFNQHE